MNNYEELKKILDFLIKHLKEEWIKGNYENKLNKKEDGRINSQEYEEFILEIIEKGIKKEYTNIQFIKPKIREWYDFALKLNLDEKEYFIPINIKTKDMIKNKHGADNLSSKKGLFWSLTGKEVETNKWDDFFETLLKNTQKDLDYIYDYFLLVFFKNKDNIQDSFWTSLRLIPDAEIRVNGNNLPFQIKHTGKKLCKPRSHQENFNFYLGILIKSIFKRCSSILNGTVLFLNNYNDQKMDFIFQNDEFKKILDKIFDFYNKNNLDKK